jgi:iron(III) transport system permease protein
MALRGLDRRLHESARLTNGRWQTFIHVTVPLTGPPILSGSLFVYILAMINFNVASLLQVVTYPVEIYTRFSLSYSPGHATAQAMPLLLVGLAPVALWMVFARSRKGWMKRPEYTTQKPSAPFANAAGIVYASFLAAISVLLPVGLLVTRAGPLKTYGEAWATAKEEIVTSLIVATISATAITLLAFVGSYLAHKGSRAAKAGQLAIVPFLISGPLIGIGLIFLWNRPGPAGLVYDSVAVLIIASMARYAFLAHQGIAVALSAIDPKLEEAARVAGIPLWRQAGGIVMPLLAPALIVAWVLSFIYTFSEVDATILVCPPGWTTLPVRLHTLMHYGPSNLIAALSVITIAIVMTAAGAGALAFGLVRRQLHGRH